MSSIVLAGFVAAALALGVVADAAPSATGDAASNERARRGEVYDGLRRGADNGRCKGAYEAVTADGKANCSHGPDPAPDDVDVRRKRSTTEVAATTASGAFAAASGLLPCYGDGTSGQRVQAIYARASDVADRFASIAPLIPRWAAGTDAVFANSAATTGGVRHIKWLTTAGCVLTVANVVLSTTGDDNFTNTINELKAKGYNRTDRKYLVWTDANVYCGIGTIMVDDRAGSTNWNNVGPSFSRVDSGCWGLTYPVEAHEVMHNLGGVQTSAPHATAGFHCTDESDRMCYPDANGVTMSYVCGSANEALFDCGRDDYFTTATASGYLATHWNAASNAFLSGAQPDVWGDPTAPSPTPTPTPTPTPPPGPTPSPTYVTSTSTGTLGTTTTTRSYTVTSGTGWLWAATSFTGTPAVTLRIRNASGVILAQKYGASPLQVMATVPAGTYTVSIIGSRATYTLKISRPKV